MGAARVAGHVLEHQVVTAPQLAQEPGVGLAAQGGAAAEEHALQQRASIRRDHPLLKAVAVELRHPLEQIPEEQQALWGAVGMGLQQLQQ